MSLTVHVGRALESQRELLVPMRTTTPIEWFPSRRGLEVRARYALASFSLDESGSGEGDFWTFRDDPEEFGESVTNICRVVLAVGFPASGTHVLHSSAFALSDGRAALAFGPSGAGKSTVGELALAANRPVLSDDLNLVDATTGGPPSVQAFPWTGTYGPRRWHDVPSYPLAGIFRLEQTEGHWVEPLAPARAVAGLASCSPFVNADAGKFAALLASLEDLVRRVPTFTLGFRKDPGFLDLVDGVLR